MDIKTYLALSAVLFIAYPICFIFCKNPNVSYGELRKSLNGKFFKPSEYFDKKYIKLFYSLIIITIIFGIYTGIYFSSLQQ